MKIGSHVGMSGKDMLLGSAKEAVSYGADTFMFYTGAPQNTRRKEISELNIGPAWDYMEEHGIDEIIVHAPYIINLANTVKPETYELAERFLALELERTAACKSQILILHPGAHVGAGVDAGIAQIVRGLNHILTPDTPVCIALETMAGKGSEVGGRFEELRAILDAVDEGSITNTQIVGVISNNKNAYALTRAKEHQVAAQCISPKDFATREEFNEKFLEAVDEIGPDLIVLAGFLVVIPAEMIERYRNRIINIHPSLIPSFCGTGFYGLKVHEAALKRGVKVVGATVHFVDEGTDTGPIILQKAVEVEEGDTPEILQRRVMEQAEWKILPKAIDLIANGRVTVEDNRVRIDRRKTNECIDCRKRRKRARHRILRGQEPQGGEDILYTGKRGHCRVCPVRAHRRHGV